MDDTLFLFQYKDTAECRWTKAELQHERSKMGAGHATATEAQATVEALKAVWKSAMHKDVLHVKRCFVTPNKHSFGCGAGQPRVLIPSPEMHGVTADDLFVTMNYTEFLKFDPNGARGKGTSHSAEL